jgi:enoyl-CoA hydratase/carnithine racemase
MAYEFVGYEQDGRVVTITFDRPERMNAIGPVMSAELVDAWTRFRDDDSALVAVLTGRRRRVLRGGRPEGRGRTGPGHARRAGRACQGRAAGHHRAVTLVRYL